MKIFGKPLSEYVAFAKLFLILIPLVGLLRLGLSLEGVPQSTVQLFSMTALGFIGMVYFAIRVHTTGFGSYKQLLVLIALTNLVAQMVAIVGILLAMVTGVGNIFSAPEFSFGGVNPWVHLAMHVFVGTTAGALVPWAIGSLILAITRKVSGFSLPTGEGGPRQRAG
jgi:hypothetical protein